jgi:hypothetical protein
VKAPRWRWGKWWCSLTFVPTIWAVGTLVNRQPGAVEVVVMVPCLRLLAWRYR